MTVEVTPPDGAAQFAVWKQWVERQIVALGRARRLPNASLRDGALDILADNGDLRARLGKQDDTRVAQTFYDTSGNELIRLGEQPNGTTGLNIAAGRLTVEGATVDAIWADQGDDAAQNVLLTTTLTPHTSVELAVPTWATRVFVTATIGFQMTTGASPQQKMWRLEIGGVPSGGATTDGQPANETTYGSQTRSRVIVAPGATVLVRGLYGVTLGTNSANNLRLDATLIALRS